MFKLAEWLSLLAWLSEGARLMLDINTIDSHQTISGRMEDGRNKQYMKRMVLPVRHVQKRNGNKMILTWIEGVRTVSR